MDDLGDGGGVGDMGNALSPFVIHDCRSHLSLCRGIRMITSPGDRRGSNLRGSKMGFRNLQAAS